MSDGINPSELNEAPQRTDQVKETAEVKPEVQEAAVSLEKATLKPEEKVETEREIQASEDLEEEVTAAVDAVPEASEAKPAEISLEAAGADGTVRIEAPEPATDRGPGTEDGKDVTGRQGDMETGGELDPDPVDAGEVRTTDLPAGSGAETVMIDTVPLPESPAAETTADWGPRTEDREVIIDSNDGASQDADQREAIGTWPTPDSAAMMEGDEEPIQGMVGDSHLMEEEGEPVQARTAGLAMEEEEPVQARTAGLALEEEEPVQGLTDHEIVNQLMDQLPESAAAFTDQAASQIVELTLAYSGADFVSPIRSAIQEQNQDLSTAQVDGLLVASLLKAAESLNTGELPDQPPDPGVETGINPSYPGTDPSGSGDPGLEPPPTGDDRSGLNDPPSPEDLEDREAKQAAYDEYWNQVAGQLLPDLQDAMNAPAQLMQIIVNIVKNLQDEANALIENKK